MANNELKLFLQRALREYEKDDSLNISTVMDEEGYNKGDGFMSKALAVEVVGEFGSGKPYSNKLFIKNKPSSAARVELFNLKSLFNNEAILYSEILPLLPEGCGIIPRCIYGNDNCIVLENLCDQGYKMADKLKGLDLNQSELAMKAIADFHASTYALSVVNEIKYSQIVSKISDILKDNKTFENIYESSLLRGINNLKEIDDGTITLGIQRLEPLKNKMKTTMQELRTSDVIVLGHGDFWINNMMFRYKDGAVEDIKIIDFQAISPVTPAVDIWKFLYTGLSPDTLNSFCDQLISVYCNHFTESIRKLDLPKNKQICYDILKREIYSKELYGLLIAHMYLPNFYIDFSDESFHLDQYMSNIDYLKQSENLILPDFGERLGALVKRCLYRGVI